MPLTIRVLAKLGTRKKNRRNGEQNGPITQCKQQKRMKTQMAQPETVPNIIIRVYVVNHKFRIPKRIRNLHSLAHSLQSQYFFQSLDHSHIILLSKRIPKQTLVSFIMTIPNVTCAAVNATGGFDLSHAICTLYKFKHDSKSKNRSTLNTNFFFKT